MPATSRYEILLAILQAFSSLHLVNKDFLVRQTRDHRIGPVVKIVDYTDIAIIFETFETGKKTVIVFLKCEIGMKDVMKLIIFNFL